MASKQYDIAIIGGGILGLATAMQLSHSYPRQRIIVLEKEQELARHQTGHNSGVIHSGLYYRPGSAKATFCVDGARRLREFCDQHNIKYDLVGKVVVATSEEEVPALDTLFERGTANGVEGIEMIGREELSEMEPFTQGVRAIRCPMTGIVDYKEVCSAYATEFRESGGDIVTGARVRKIARSNGRTLLETTQGEVDAGHLINCAGLQADVIVSRLGLPSDVRIIPFRGEYYTLVPEKHHMVKGLIYPVPNPLFPFLGVHFTRRITGEVEAGPNAVLAFAREGYSKRIINVPELMGTLTYPGFWRMAKRYWKTGMGEMQRSFSKRAFTRALQKLMPELQESDLAPAGSGVRAQAVDRKGNLLDDFSIVETGDAIHVLNAPSPAATSSLAIADHIVGLASKSFGLEG